MATSPATVSTIAALVVAIVLILLCIAYAAIAWSVRGSKRALLRGIGAAICVAGLWSVGFLNLLTVAFDGFVSWLKDQTPLSVMSWIGLILLAVGLVIWVIGSFFKPTTREGAKEWRTERKDTDPKSAMSPSDDKQKPGTTPKPNSDRLQSTPSEDAEVERILRAHGIE